MVFDKDGEGRCVHRGKPFLRRTVLGSIPRGNQTLILLRLSSRNQQRLVLVRLSSRDQVMGLVSRCYTGSVLSFHVRPRRQGCLSSEPDCFSLLVVGCGVFENWPRARSKVAFKLPDVELRSQPTSCRTGSSALQPSGSHPFSSLLSVFSHVKKRS